MAVGEGKKSPEESDNDGKADERIARELIFKGHVERLSLRRSGAD